MQARLLLQLLSSPRSPFRRGERGLSRFTTKRKRSEQGFSLALALTLVLGLIAASLGLAFRSSSSLQNSANQSLNREATAVAEVGITEIMGELGKPANRRMLVSGKPLNAWNTTPDPLQQNPCLNSTTITPTTLSARNLANNTYKSIDSTHRYILRRVRYSTDSSTTPITPRANFVDYKFNTPGFGTSITQTPATPTFVNNKNDQINLNFNSVRDNVGYFEIEVQGQVLNANGTPTATSTVIKEFQVVPKCCDRSFSGPYTNTFPPTATNAYGNDSRFCKGGADLGLLYGFNNGTFTANGQAGTLLSLDFFGNVVGLPGIVCITDPYSGSYNPATTCKDRVGSTYNSFFNAKDSSNQNYPVYIYPAIINNDPPPTFAALFPTSTKTASNITTANYFKTTTTGIDRYNIVSSGSADNTATEVNESLLLNSPNTSLWSTSCEKAVTGSRAKQIADYHCRIGKIDYNSGNLILDTSAGSIALYFDNPVSGSGSPGIKISGSTTLQHRLCTASYAATAVCGKAAPSTDFKRLNLYSNRSDAIVDLRGSNTTSASLFIYMNNGSVNIGGNTSLSGAIWTKDLTLAGSFTSAASSVNCSIDTSGFCYVAGGGSTGGAPLFDWKARSVSRTRMYTSS